MKAIILAAGTGTRMEIDFPKCLNYVTNFTILDNCIQSLRYNNIKDIIIVTGFRSDKIVEECLPYLSDDINISFVYNEKYNNANNCISLLKGLQIVNDDLLIIESDIFFDCDIIKDLTSEKHKFCWAVDNFEKGMTGSALVTNRDGRIIHIKYLTEFRPHKYKSVGMLYVPGEFVKTLKTWLEDRQNDNQYYDEVIAYHLPKLPIYIKNISGKLWYEVDTQEDLKKAKELFNGL